MSDPVIESRRVTLVPKTLEAVRARIDRMTAAERAELSSDWLAQLDSAAVDHWTLGFDIVERATDVVLGGCGYKGPPATDGTVEIAYHVAAPYRGRGFATEAAAALVGQAFGSGLVGKVRAHTLSASNASARVLTKCGFHTVGEITDPEDGVVWRWEIERDEHLLTPRGL